MNVRPHLVPALASALLLLAATGDHPYRYFTFLRWVVFLSSCLVAWVAWGSVAQPAAFLFAAVAVMFNPVAPVYLARSTWQPIDMVCAGLFAISMVITRTQIPPEPGARDADRDTTTPVGSQWNSAVGRFPTLPSDASQSTPEPRTKPSTGHSGNADSPSANPSHEVGTPLMTMGVRDVAELTERTARAEFLAIAATHNKVGGGTAGAIQVAREAAPAMRARLARIVDEVIAPQLQAAEAEEERCRHSPAGHSARERDRDMLLGAVVIFPHEAEDHLTKMLQEWVSSGAPRIVS